MYDPSSGSIWVDGQNVQMVQIDSLRKQISVVPQDTALFNDTIYYNILYGNPDLAGRDDVVAAAKKAHIHEVIQGLPDKYETRVGERGLMLSGGEKQRVALSRAILKQSPIMFFDEATSALDTHTETALLGSIRNMLKEGGKTSIFIAHRLRTVQDADLILVLVDGKVQEQGTHRSLMAKGPENGVYHRMWKAQEETSKKGLLKYDDDAESEPEVVDPNQRSK